jgi:hypothetical protein
MRLGHVLFTATHSMMSTYFGSITMVLKLPLTKAASTKGLHRYKGFGGALTGDAGTTGLGGTESAGEKVAEVGVGDLLGPRGALVIDRLNKESQGNIYMDKWGTLTL